MIITESTQIDNVPAEELGQFVEKLLDNVVQVVNGNLDFQTNFNCKIVNYTFAAANTQYTVPHGLGRATNNFLVIYNNTGGIVYNGTQSVLNGLNLIATAVGTVTLVVF